MKAYLWQISYVQHLVNIIQLCEPTLSDRADQEECSNGEISLSAARLACYFCLAGTTIMNTSYPNEGAQLHVNGAEAKPGTNMEGLLLSNLGVFFSSSSQTPSCRVIKQEIQLRLALLKVKFR